MKLPFAVAFVVLCLFSPNLHAQTCTTLCSTGQSATTTGTSVQTMYTCPIGALELNSDGDYLEVHYSGKKKNNPNPQDQKLIFGSSNVVWNTTSFNNAYFISVARIYYRTDTSQTIWEQIHRAGNVIAGDVAQITEDTTIANNLDLVLTTPTAAADVTFHSFTVRSCSF